MPSDAAPSTSARERALLTARLASYYTAHFFVTGVHLPFWPVWLRSRGLDEDEIGLALGIGFWTSIVASPGIGRLADRAPDPRRVMTVLGVLSTALFAAFTLAHGFWACAVLTLAVFAVFSPMLPLAESATQARVRRGEVHYGRARLWGSLSFLLTSIGAGRLLDGGSPDWVLWLVIGGSALCLVATRVLPDVPPREGARASLRTVLGLRAFVLCVALAALVQGSHSVMYGFGTLYWQRLGISETWIGVLWAEGVIAEIALFWVGSRVTARLGAARLLLLGAAAATVRWIGLALIEEPWALLAVQLLHALSFGATHLAGMEIVRRSLPAPMLATGQGLYTSIASVSYAIGMTGAGALFARFEGGAFFVAAASSGVATLVIAIAGRRWVARAEADALALSTGPGDGRARAE